MNFLKIATRLQVLVAVLSMLLVTVGLFALRSAHLSNEALKTVYEDRTLPMGQLAAINRLTLRSRLDIANSVLDPVPEQITINLTDLAESMAEIQDEWTAYKATYLTPEEEKIAKKYEEDFRLLIINGINPAIEALNRQDPQTAHLVIINWLTTITLAG